jgi:hypothetical protein
MFSIYIILSLKIRGNFIGKQGMIYIMNLLSPMISMNELELDLKYKKI